MNSEPLAEGKPGLIERLLTALIGTVIRRPRMVLTVAGLLCAISVWAFCTGLAFRTERNDLINADKPYQQRWREYLAEFGNDEDMVLVVQGEDKPRMKAALDALAERIRQHPDMFDRLFYKVDLRSLRNRALLYLPQNEIAKIQKNLDSMRLLLDLGEVGWYWFTVERLVEEAVARTRKLEPEEALSEGDRQFLSQLASIGGSASSMLADRDDYKNPWRSILSSPPEHQDLMSEPQYFFSEDGQLAFLLVRPVKEEGSSFTASQTNVQTMRQLVEEVRPNFADLEIGLTGLPVLETDEMVASQNDTQTSSWLALAGVTVLFFLMFRNWRSPLLTVSALVVGTIWAMGWLTLTVGHLNILSATFAMMLIGMGDYGVLWITRYEEERRDGLTVRDALLTTARSVGPGVLTAAVTTALAFYAAMLADFQAVSELGWIAGSGVLLCALSCFTVLPAMIVLLDRRCELKIAALYASKPLSRQIDRVWLPGLMRRPRWVIGTGLVLTALLAISALFIRYDHNLLHMQAEGLDSVKWELRLIEHTAGASWHALSFTDTPEQALALKAKYEKLPGVSRVVEVASLVPRKQDAKLDQLRDIQHRLRYLPPRGQVMRRYPGRTAGLKKKLDELLFRLRELDSGRPQTALAELRGNLAQLRGRLEEAPDADVAQRLCEFEQKLTGDLAEDLHRLRDVSQPSPVVVADLPTDLRERYIGANGQWLLRVFGKESLWEYGPLLKFVNQIITVDPGVTGKPISTLDGLRTMKRGFQWAGVYALGAIVLVLLWDFRRPRHILLALAPLGMGVVCALGIMGLCGWPLNPANMIAFPLIVGVGVDNGVHVLHDYVSRTRRRRYRLNHTTGRGIMTAALTTILGFGTLMISSHRGLVGLGFILTLGVGCCMLSALVFLPAVLHIFSNRHKEEPTASVEIKEVRRAA
jgi:hypothetical protein